MDGWRFSLNWYLIHSLLARSLHGSFPLVCIFANSSFGSKSILLYMYIWRRQQQLYPVRYIVHCGFPYHISGLAYLRDIRLRVLPCNCNNNEWFILPSIIYGPSIRSVQTLKKWKSSLSGKLLFPFFVCLASGSVSPITGTMLSHVSTFSFPTGIHLRTIFFFMNHADWRVDTPERTWSHLSWIMNPHIIIISWLECKEQRYKPPLLII